MGLNPGYKQTEVGVIPEDWEAKSLGDMGLVIRGASPRPKGDKRFYGGSVPRLMVEDITRDKHWVTPSIDYLTYEGAKQSRRCKSGTLAVVCSGTPTAVGLPALLAIDACIHDGILALVKIRRGVSGDFLFHQLSSLQQRLHAAATHGGTFVNLTTEAFRAFKIAIPPTKAEQEAIAEVLSDADALIESLEQLIAKKRNLKQGATQELLTGKKRLPGFGGEWQDLFVDDVIVRLFCGPSPTCDERNIIGDSEWGVLKTTAITWANGWDWTKHKVLPQRFWNQPDLQVRPGDVIVTKAGPRHRVGVTAWVDYVPKRIIVSGKMIGLRPNPEKAVPLMLASAIASKESQVFLDQRTTGMAESQVNFENTALLRTPIRMPRIEEQNAIAAILSDMDAEIAALKAKLAKARQIRQGMMQELLTGRIRLV